MILAESMMGFTEDGEGMSKEELAERISKLAINRALFEEGRALPKLKKRPKGGYGNPYHDGKTGKFSSKAGGSSSKPKVSLKNGKPESLSHEQYQALRPTGEGFSVARRDAAIAKLSSTPEGAIVAKFAHDFQHEPSAQFRNEIVAVNATGKYQTKAGTERAKAFLKASSEVPREILPDKLYRGVTVSGSDAKSIAAGYRKAGSTTLNVSSFTASPRIAREYTTHHVGAKGPNDPFVKVITTVNVGDKAQMLPIQNISGGKDTHRDQEYLGLGTFKITNVAVKGNEVHLEMEQTGMILAKEG